jgi:hypothetical protein
MSTHYVVVDGSNIATEGRSQPSLRQLDEAVRAFLTEHPADQLTVVVDATFGHRIDPSETDAYEEAVLAGELVSPPAGAIGRGDAFVLQIADKADAVVLSNDSFQEFHGQYPWLFDEGRLIGGKPVPGLGWVFLLRSPVRGPASRRSVKEARTAKAPGGRKTTAGRGAAAAPNRKSGKSEKSEKARKADKTAKGPKTARTDGAGRGATRAAKKAPAARGSTPKGDGGRRPRGSAKPTDPLNDLLPFVDFVGAHPVGSEVDAIVESFSSHGAYAQVGEVRCYVPLKSMGDPPPLRARDVLTVGETRTFTVSSVDAPRRGIDLALETKSDASDLVTVQLPQGVPIGTVARQVKRDAQRNAATSAAVTATNSVADHHAEEAPVTPAKKAAAKRAPAKKASARKRVAKKTTAKRAPARKRVAKKAPARKRVAKKAPARKRVAKRTTARRR